MNVKNKIEAAVFGISRLRMGIDGPGVTTLVTFMGCPLHCKYCINEKCHEPVSEADGKTVRPGIILLSPQELYDRVKKDNIYFQATGGGICFGGGEPGLQSEFIEEFRRICGDKWTLTIETSLNYDPKHLERLIHVIDHWIVDIKELSPKIYKRYTGANLDLAYSNLNRLVDHKERVIVRTPIIPGFNKGEDVDISCDKLALLGFQTDKLTYLTPEEYEQRKRKV